MPLAAGQDFGGRKAEERKRERAEAGPFWPGCRGIENSSAVPIACQFDCEEVLGGIFSHQRQFLGNESRCQTKQRCRQLSLSDLSSAYGSVSVCVWVSVCVRVRAHVCLPRASFQFQRREATTSSCLPAGSCHSSCCWCCVYFLFGCASPT